MATRLVPQRWEVSNPSNPNDVFDSILNGTVRAAAVLRRQPPEVLARIRETARLDDRVLPHRGYFRVPMPAVLTIGIKPATS